MWLSSFTTVSHWSAHTTSTAFIRLLVIAYLWQLKTIQHRGLPLTYNTTTDWAIQNNDLSLELYVLRLSLPIPEGIQAATGLIPAVFTNHSVKNSYSHSTCADLSILVWTEHALATYTNFLTIYFVCISTYIFLCSATLIRISYLLHGFRRHQVLGF